MRRQIVQIEYLVQARQAAILLMRYVASGREQPT